MGLRRFPCGHGFGIPGQSSGLDNCLERPKSATFSCLPMALDPPGKLSVGGPSMNGHATDSDHHRMSRGSSRSLSGPPTPSGPPAPRPEPGSGVTPSTAAQRRIGAAADRDVLASSEARTHLQAADIVAPVVRTSSMTTAKQGRWPACRTDWFEPESPGRSDWAGKGLAGTRLIRDDLATNERAALRGRSLGATSSCDGPWRLRMGRRSLPPAISCTPRAITSAWSMPLLMRRHQEEGTGTRRI